MTARQSPRHTPGISLHRLIQFRCGKVEIINRHNLHRSAKLRCRGFEPGTEARFAATGQSAQTDQPPPVSALIRKAQDRKSERPQPVTACIGVPEVQRGRCSTALPPASLPLDGVLDSEEGKQLPLIDGRYQTLSIRIQL